MLFLREAFRILSSPLQPTSLLSRISRLNIISLFKYSFGYSSTVLQVNAANLQVFGAIEGDINHSSPYNGDEFIFIWRLR
jgi:hypothetical protein